MAFDDRKNLSPTQKLLQAAQDAIDSGKYVMALDLFTAAGWPPGNDVIKAAQAELNRDRSADDQLVIEWYGNRPRIWHHKT